MFIEHQCQRLQAVYALAADRGDVAAFVECFTTDGEILIPGAPPFRGREAIGASLTQLGSLGVTYRHLITNSVITVHGPDSATGICYLLTFNSAEPAGADGSRPIDLPGTVGEYHDDFVRTEEGWRIRRRELKRVFRRDDAVAQAARARGG